jgi:hypothetical protein
MACVRLPQQTDDDMLLPHAAAAAAYCSGCCSANMALRAAAVEMNLYQGTVSARRCED